MDTNSQLYSAHERCDVDSNMLLMRNYLLATTVIFLKLKLDDFLKEMQNFTQYNFS